MIVCIFIKKVREFNYVSLAYPIYEGNTIDYIDCHTLSFQEDTICNAQEEFLIISKNVY